MEVKRLAVRSHDLLPTVRPRSYHLTLAPTDDFTRIRGSVAIDVILSEPSTVLRLHSLELEILSARVVFTLSVRTFRM